MSRHVGWQGASGLYGCRAGALLHVLRALANNGADAVPCGTGLTAAKPEKRYMHYKNMFEHLKCSLCVHSNAVQFCWLPPLPAPAHLPIPPAQSTCPASPVGLQRTVPHQRPLQQPTPSLHAAPRHLVAAHSCLRTGPAAQPAHAALMLVWRSIWTWTEELLRSTVGGKAHVAAAASPRQQHMAAVEG